ncbi:type IV pilin protein [Halanaerobium saccharolyticum]|uniref:type IV pilin protein n=1 Tax=Halanaerobium saccharolyticum TaxID=43595 RepID=UPI003FCD314D
MRKLREKIYNDAAFTLIELLVVIAVLGILAGIAVPRITGVQDQARREALNATAISVRNAMEMAYASSGQYPTLGSLSNSSLGALSAAISSGTGISISLSGNDDINVVSASTSTDTTTNDAFDIELSFEGNNVSIDENGVN